MKNTILSIVALFGLITLTTGCITNEAYTPADAKAVSDLSNQTKEIAISMQEISSKFERIKSGSTPDRIDASAETLSEIAKVTQMANSINTQIASMESNMTKLEALARALDHNKEIISGGLNAALPGSGTIAYTALSAIGAAATLFGANERKKRKSMEKGIARVDARTDIDNDGSVISAIRKESLAIS